MLKEVDNIFTIQVCDYSINRHLLSIYYNREKDQALNTRIKPECIQPTEGGAQGNCIAQQHLRCRHKVLTGAGTEVGGSEGQGRGQWRSILKSIKR